MLDKINTKIKMDNDPTSGTIVITMDVCNCLAMVKAPNLLIPHTCKECRDQGISNIKELVNYLGDSLPDVLPRG